jgi:uncharacterized protein DUF4149
MIKDIRLFLLSLWLGAAIFFSAVVAPSAFSVLRTFHLANSSEIAGDIVNRALSVLNTSGFIVSLLLLLTVFAIKKGSGQRLLFVEVISLAIVAITTGIGQWVVAVKMHALRAAMAVSIDQIPADDARRVAFNSLHGYSVAALAIAMIAALVAFLAATRRARLN